MRSQRLAVVVRLIVFAVTLASSVLSSAQAGRPTPPPEPSVKPIVSAPTNLDANGDKVDDRISNAITSATNVMARRDAGSAEKAAAQSDLDATVTVELVFSAQITQAQIDAFLKAGGTIDHVFTNVSYGWTGSIARKRVPSLPGLLGATLLGIVEKQDVQLHLDEAARTGRVRPTVWNAGIAGVSSGTDQITIGILDTGIDGTHTDLAGRQEYWKDWTSDARPSPQDVGHHGSHVTGIATGSGAASGVSPTTISFCDFGVFPSTAGSFYPGPVHIPASVTTANFTSTMAWDAAGGTVQLTQVVRRADGAWVSLQTPVTSKTSPVTVTSSSTNPAAGYTNAYSAFASWSKRSGASSGMYAVNTTASYAGVGDGYNTLRGVAPGCKWAGFKIFTDAGSGSSTDIDEALDDLVAQRLTHKIKVANMSVGMIGDPGISLTTRNKANTAVSNGIVLCISAGNDGLNSTTPKRVVDDPGRAQYVITVAAASDISQLTDYTSEGFAAPGDTYAGDEDMKPDIMAPGGSATKQSAILSIDSNTADAEDGSIADQVPNNYANMQGTSMASPFMAGCSALVIQALQNSGYTWQYTLNDALLVKMLLLMTATESNQIREATPAGNPTLNRGAKDTNEGYGMVNADAAVEANTNAIVSGLTFTDNNITLGSSTNAACDKRCYARRVQMRAARPTTAILTVPPTGDFDLYLYRSTPDSYGNPVILASSVNAAAGATETINYTPSTTQVGYIVVKRVSGYGTAALNATFPVGVSSFSVD